MGAGHRHLVGPTRGGDVEQRQEPRLVDAVRKKTAETKTVLLPREAPESIPMGLRLQRLAVHVERQFNSEIRIEAM